MPPALPATIKLNRYERLLLLDAPNGIESLCLRCDL
jgi:hypothetical protein